MAALRDHGPTGTPQWSVVNGALAAPCAHAGGRVTSTQSTSSWVADLAARSALGHRDVGALHVAVQARPRRGSRLSVEPAEAPTGSYDPAYVWWRHELLHRLVLRDHSLVDRPVRRRA